MRALFRLFGELESFVRAVRTVRGARVDLQLAAADRMPRCAALPCGYETELKAKRTSWNSQSIKTVSVD